MATLPAGTFLLVNDAGFAPARLMDAFPTAFNILRAKMNAAGVLCVQRSTWGGYQSVFQPNVCFSSTLILRYGRVTKQIYPRDA